MCLKGICYDMLKELLYKNRYKFAGKKNNYIKGEIMRLKIGQQIIDKIRGKKKRIHKVIKSHYGYKHINYNKEGNDIIYDELCKDSPSLICRFGSVELSTAVEFIEKNNEHCIQFSDDIKRSMSYNAGFFPATDYMLSKFASEFIEIVKNIDVIGVWFNRGEDEILTKFAQSAQLVHLEALNPITTRGGGKLHYAG